MFSNEYDGLIKTVTAAIIEENSCVLVCRRAKGKSLEGHWEFPGGGQEKGESIQECLEREIWEELGIEIAAGEVMMEHTHNYPKFSIHLIAIHASIISGDIELSVHDKYEWAQIENLLNFELAPADIPFAEFLTGRLK